MAHTSLWSQVRVALFALCRFGEKRHEYKHRGEAHQWIFYYQTYRKYLDNCWSIIQSIQERHNINMLIKIRPWMVREEFHRRIQEGQSAWTLWAYRSSLVKLEHGIFLMYGFKHRLVPRNMVLPPRRIVNRKDRFAYSPEQVKKIILAAYQICSDGAIVLELISYSGLRIHEALKLRARDIQAKKLIVFKGKGGKRREVPIPDNARDLIEELLWGKSDMDLIFQRMTQQKVRGCMKKACEAVGIAVHKPHNLRHYYAVKEYKQARDDGAGDKSARLDISKKLGHNRRSVTYAYMPPAIRPGRRK